MRLVCAGIGRAARGGGDSLVFWAVHLVGRLGRVQLSIDYSAKIMLYSPVLLKRMRLQRLAGVLPG